MDTLEYWTLEEYRERSAPCLKKGASSFGGAWIILCGPLDLQNLPVPSRPVPEVI